MEREADRPTDTWLGEPVERWRQRWDLPMLCVYTRVGSTNDAARTLAENGAPAGTVVLADEQTRGRGRRGRGWISAPGSGLLLSVVLRPGGAGPHGVLPLRLGMAAARAVERLAPVAVRVKWPNDLLIGRRKVGGLLCEATVEGGRPLFLVAGIGINISQTPAEWPPELRGRATSIAAEAGRTLPRDALAGAVLREVLDAARLGLGSLADRELEELRGRDLLRGRRVTVDGTPAGAAAGIAADGALVVERGGIRARVVAGTVRLVEPAEVES